MKVTVDFVNPCEDEPVAKAVIDFVALPLVGDWLSVPDKDNEDMSVIVVARNWVDGSPVLIVELDPNDERSAKNSMRVPVVLDVVTHDRHFTVKRRFNHYPLIGDLIVNIDDNDEAFSGTVCSRVWVGPNLHLSLRRK